MDQYHSDDLLAQWMAAYEDQKSMVDRPQDHLQMLDDLASQLAASAAIGDELHQLLLRKAQDAYLWANEFRVLAGIT